MTYLVTSLMRIALMKTVPQGRGPGRVDSEVHRVRKLLEYTDQEVKDTIKCIKAARESENIIHSLVSNSTDFRSALDEMFFV